ncbi:MAG: methylenetetrahydrofolate reductase [NAD(P)H] [Mariprofundaceae bacterium]|nr:methylenetetrahydrofolate reductase [NAD(P)H] [Mariprofundaceae bacterium]
MKFKQLYQQGPRLSCEFFPPKTDQGEKNLWRCLDELKKLDPAYFSVTYGAGGSTQDRTKNIVTQIKERTGVEAVAHLTCVGSSSEQLGALLDDYAQAGMTHILALRGDKPEDQASFQVEKSGFAHATALVRLIAKTHADFAVAVATYPEGHPESKHGLDDDIRYLKMKQDEGATLAITQYFFDNEVFYRFRDKAVAAGVNLPIIPGIMPILNFTQIKRFSAMCGTSIPVSLHDKMTPVEDDLDAVKAIGIAVATAQCADLLKHDVAGLHFYTLNKADATCQIVKVLGL